MAAFAQATVASSPAASSVVPPGWLWFTNGQPLTEVDQQRLKRLEQWFSQTPPLEESQRNRLAWLEMQGQIPTNGSPVDLELAPRTSWWGQRLDPKEFWEGKTVWNDRSAENEARRRGRVYPPIPVHLTNLVNRFPLNSRDHAELVAAPWEGGLDSGPVIPYHSTDAEGAFWNWFWMTKPKSPETLEREQLDAAESLLRTRRLEPARPPDPGAMSDHDRAVHEEIRKHLLAESEAAIKSRAEGIGVPKEALTEDALFWSYVMKHRQEYEKTRAESQNLPARFFERRIESILRRSAVETNFLIAPLTPEQIKTANGWKTNYLNRLQAENVDAAYIATYLKAWNLPATALSSHTNRP